MDQTLTLEETKKTTVDTVYNKSILDIFLLEHYTPVVYRSIKQLFELFDILNFSHYEDDYMLAIYNEEFENKSDVPSIVFNLIKKDIDSILLEHRIYISDDATFLFKVEFLEGLVTLNYLKDYSHIDAILSDTDSTEFEKFIDIMSSVTSITPEDLSLYVDDFTPMFFDALKSYIKERESLEETNFKESKHHKIMKRLRKHTDLFKDNIAYRRVKEGMSINLPFSEYLDNIDMSKRREELSLDIFSFLIISSDGYNTPIQTYKKTISVKLGDFIKDEDILTGIQKLLLTEGDNIG